MGRGHQGRSLRPFHVSQHHPSPPRLLLPRILNKPAGEGPRGQARPGGSAFVAQSSTAAGRQRGRGRGPETLSRGLTPRCIVRRCPPPPPRSATLPAPSQRLPPPAAPTSRSPDQGPDVESSPQAGSSGAVHSAAPALSSRRLTPPPGRTLGPPASCEPVSVRRPPRDQRAGPAAPSHAGARTGSPGCARPAAARGTAAAGPAGGQRPRSGRRACPRSPAEWRLLCDPSPGRGRQGCCCSARSCSGCSSTRFQVGALSSALLLRLWGVSGLGRGRTGGACCGGGVLRGG